MRIATVRFGKNCVSPGSKAVTISGLSNYADVDLVPTLHYHRIFKFDSGELGRLRGVAIRSKDGTTTINFPEQHHSNGKNKRVATRHKFEKVVRMLKRLNGELCEVGLIEKPVPSFLVECLVYIVENHHFLYSEDRYMRLCRVLARSSDLLSDTEWAKEATEANEIKYLFRPNQAWTLEQAQVFVVAALARLEA